MAGSMPVRLLFSQALSSSERLPDKYTSPDKIKSMFVYSSLTHEVDSPFKKHYLVTWHFSTELHDTTYPAIFFFFFFVYW